MAGLLTQQTAQPAIDPNMSTEDLYALSRQQEAGFTQTAPKGYLSNDLPKDIPANVGASWVEGYRMRQEDMRKNATISMAQEQQGWQRTDREKRRMIDDGIINAAGTGGFEGALDYLKTADPERAMQFSIAKDKMDQSMMQTEIFKSALPNEKAKLMIEGYGIMGKMGAALLNAPSKDRDNMYQHMLPILKTVNPDAPSSLNQSALDMFQLAVAQATPENQLWNAKKSATTLNSALGVAMQDAHKAAQLYGPDSPEAGMARKYLQDVAESKGALVASTAQDMQNKAKKLNMSQEAVMRKELLNLNKNYMTVQDNFNKIQATAQAYQQAEKDPTTPFNYGPSDTALIFNFMKILDPTSVVRESEFATAANSGGVPQAVQAEYNKVLKGGALSPEMRQEFLKTSKQLYEASKKSYDQNNSTYRDLATRNGLNPDNVIMNINSSIQSGQQIINSKADAMLEKYQGNPEAIKRIEALRQSQLQQLNANGAAEDHQVDQLLKTYGR
jgi:hypothetical protein